MKKSVLPIICTLTLSTGVFNACNKENIKQPSDHPVRELSSSSLSSGGNKHKRPIDVPFPKNPNSKIAYYVGMMNQGDRDPRYGSYKPIAVDNEIITVQLPKYFILRIDDLYKKKYKKQVRVTENELPILSSSEISPDVLADLYHRYPILKNRNYFLLIRKDIFPY